MVLLLNFGFYLAKFVSKFESIYWLKRKVIIKYYLIQVHVMFI